MTDIRPSPEQLNAQAAAPTEERDLSAAIDMHRALFRADLSWLSKLHVRDGESGIGVPFNPVFEAFLDGRLGQFPYASAVMAMRVNCRVAHRPKHTERDEWNGSLCHSLLGLVIRLDYSLDAARLRLGLPEEGKSRRTLDNALLFVERRLEDMMLRSEREQQATVPRSPVDWMSPVFHQRHDQPGAHQAECPQCIRRAAA